eukprot:CAMPEP_0167744116 /NCGR_PEP_ID=MMETSP0110_2-20121227/2400_1 /TAXON_ID=629695 /ORGANISM="Gymnochlora sp., Strain CCMP2014" /LENGTH=270 /DNA_ID=CAMNT_0007628577 /DNA_START=615 /DNA_END=1428 /DNA_ORIENTATION=+
MSQFSHCEAWDMCNIMTYRFVSSEREIDHVIQQAERTEAIIVFTLVNRDLKTILEKKAKKSNVSFVDLYGPLLTTFENVFGTQSQGTPGRRQPLDENYMDLMDCIEYTRKNDDGAQPSEWAKADLIIIGPSRAGKTPLSFYLGLRGSKVAKLSNVPGEDPPPELFQWPEKVVALTIDPTRLAYVRGERMRQFGRKTSRYADVEKIREEMREINLLYRENPEWFVVDTTNTGLEETATAIFREMDKRNMRQEDGSDKNQFGRARKYMSGLF